MAVAAAVDPVHGPMLAHPTHARGVRPALAKICYKVT